jgi:circadian clock protein KaiB
LSKKSKNFKDPDQAERGSRKEFVLRLFITGATPNSLRAVSNIKNICETYLAGIYSLEIIDVYLDQARAAKEQIVALPMLIKIKPVPQRKLIGDLSNTKRVLEALSIKD